MDVRPRTYNASFYILANNPRYNTTLTGIDVKLRSNLTSDVWATATIPIANDTISPFEYTQLSAEIVNNVTASYVNNSFSITMDGAAVAGNTFYIGLTSLFGETYNNRPNGIRKDLAQHVKDLNPKFLRFPGGNNIEGYSIYERWKWYDTVGPLIHRKSRVGDWGYTNTNGLGLLEFLEFCEDIGMEAVLAVYAGFSLDVFGQEGTSFPESRMGDVLQEILNELEYCTGDTSTQYGAMRADHGHPEPFVINFVEIGEHSFLTLFCILYSRLDRLPCLHTHALTRLPPGNEDWFSSTYPYRFPYLYNGIKTAYPNISLISTAFNENPNYTIDIPAGGLWDTHHYEEPTFFLSHFSEFDNFAATTNLTDVSVFIGEYSVFQVDTPSGVVNFSDPVGDHIFYPTLLAALGEAVYLLGAERNPNTVKLSSYAPSFQNLNWFNWTPNLVQFTASWDETILSVSYYMQSMFARWRGTAVLPATAAVNPLFWVVLLDEPSDTIYLKIVNTAATPVTLDVQFDRPYSAVNGTILTDADLDAFNYKDNATAVVPVPVAFGAEGTPSSFSWDVPGWSVSVLQFDP